jgi:hypothetical protein
VTFGPSYRPLKGVQNDHSNFLILTTLALSSTLAIAGGPRHPLEDPQANVFESAACVGPTLSSQEAANKFCRGANRVELTHFNYVLRVRQCNTLTACGDWKYIAPDGHIVADFQNNSEFSDTLADGGTIFLTTNSSAVQVAFVSQSFMKNLSGNIWTAAFLPAQSDPSISLLDSRTGSQLGGEGPRPGIAFYLNSTQSFGAMTKQVLQFTDHCARFVIQGKPSTPDNTGSWMEYQFGALARY